MIPGFRCFNDKCFSHGKASLAWFSIAIWENEPKISLHTRMKSVPVASVASGFYHSYRLYASTYGALVHHGYPHVQPGFPSPSRGLLKVPVGGFSAQDLPLGAARWGSKLDEQPWHMWILMGYLWRYKGIYSLNVPQLQSEIGWYTHFGDGHPSVHRGLNNHCKDFQWFPYPDRWS